MPDLFRKMKQTLTRGFVVLLAVLTIVGTFTPAPAHAQLPVADAPLITFFTGEKVNDSIGDSLLSAGLGSLLHATSYFARKMAYDAALYVAYGGKGQGALAFRDGIGTYLERTALDSVAAGIDKLGQPFGLNLCQVPNLQVQVFLQIGLRNIHGVGPPQTDCRWQDLKNGGLFDPDAWEQRYGTKEGLEETFATQLSVKNSDFGIAGGAIATLDRNKVQDKDAATAQRLEGSGFKPVLDLISGEILTPAPTVEEEIKATTAKHQQQLSTSQIAGLYGSRALQVFPQAASVFLNTLTSQLLNRLLTEGLFPPGGGGGDSQLALSPFAGAEYNRTFNQAERAFAVLLTRSPEQLTNYQIVPVLAACPDNPGLNNCVIDTSFQQALARAQAGDAMTIREAAEEGFLHRDWPLISPRHEDHTGNPQKCQVGRYCYSNIQKLRKLRILPLGFEVAALRSDPDKPWTLGDVIDGFDRCRRPNAQDRTQVSPDAEFPFCHLVNPNWVIDIPQARCEANIFGPQLASNNAPIRRSECVDVSTCIAEGEDGECLEFGYCTLEENIWELPGRSCEPHYNTCTTYTNTGTNIVASYLTRTVQFGECTIDSVGCRAYSTEQDANEQWVRSAIADKRFLPAGRNQALFFDDEITSVSNGCNASNDGCTAFMTADRTGDGRFKAGGDGGYLQRSESFVHIKKAPAYLGCYDILEDDPANPASIGVQWPTTRQEIENVVSQSDACNAYASVCLESEVGCEAFTPTDGGPEVPGIIADGDRCDQECVGYDTFKQVGYQQAEQGFEDEAFPLYFVPRIARETMAAEGLVCNEEVVGCDEFTNLDALAEGGEAREYYSSIKHCEDPAADGSNIEVYYSWEGSASEGFVLRTHRLRPLTEEDRDYYTEILRGGEGALLALEAVFFGGPAYANDSKEAVVANVASCNVDRYERKISDPGHPDAAGEDCKALYDQEGNVYYRLIAETTTVSTACRPLRKSEANLVVDDPITQSRNGENLCAQRGGTWGPLPGADNQNNVCVRCANGGNYVDGVCVYQGMPGEDESQQCIPQANGCRAYTGNQANNIQDLFNGSDDDFEPASNAPEALLAARANWESEGDIRVVSEATDVGLHSLQIDADRAIRTIPVQAIPFENNTFYTVSFWARGNAQNVRISLAQDGDQRGPAFVENTGIGDTWQRYQFGPIEVNNIDPEVPVQLVFDRVDGAGAYFIDHVRLTKVQDRLYLIKDTWKVAGADAPTSCDANPFDGVPGRALGCRAYTDSDNRTHYATGFSQLCREEAIGCQPLWDTYNTVEEAGATQAHVYNALCRAAAGETCQLTLDDDPIGDTCTVNPGDTSCYVQQIILPPGADLSDLDDQRAITNSTIYIPADTPRNAPVFLAAAQEHECNDTERGCMLTGLEEQVLPEATQASYEHVNTYVKNDPVLYEDTLCQAEVVGCSEFTHDSNISYFKDPQLTGNQLCVYKPPGDGERFGWFLDGVGECNGNSGDRAGDLCRSNQDCQTEGAAAGACINQGTVACYPNNLQRGGFHDIYSSGSRRYEGFVGVCPASENLCRELVDRADTSNLHPDGEPYYVIYDDQVTDRLDDCDSVSLSEGCVLFDKTDEPNKVYNTAATYTRSERANPPFSPVQPISNNDNDANILLKVDRGRQCSQWLACKTSVPIVNQKGETVPLCHQYAACDELGGGDSRCGHWVDPFDNELQTVLSATKLDYGQYVSRPVSWYDPEFSGYSIFNGFQINDLVSQTFAFSDNIEKDPAGGPDLEAEVRRSYIVRRLDTRVLQQIQGQDGGGIFDCIADAPEDNTDWRGCGPGNGGRCYNQQCIYPAHGEFDTQVPLPEETDQQQQAKRVALKKLLAELEGNSCKGFPENSSPFPVEIAENKDNGRLENISGPELIRYEFIEKQSGFEGANICQDGNCSCQYTKVTYDSGETDYWQLGKSHADGICAGGTEDGRSTDGRPCDVTQNDSCGEGGSCEEVSSIQQHIGTQGFCLEYDLSRRLGYGENPHACLTWLPVQVSVSSADIYNRHVDAGYNPGLDAERGSGAVFCSAGTRNEHGPYDPAMFVPELVNVFGGIDAMNAGYFTDQGVPRVRRRHIEVVNQNGQDIERETHIGNTCANYQFFNNQNPLLDYGAMVCDDRNRGRSQGLYQLIRGWTWDRWPNSVILRMETAHDSRSPSRGDVFGTEWNVPFVNKNDFEVWHPWAFIPARDADDGLLEREIGTKMHPPRIWDWENLDPGLLNVDGGRNQQPPVLSAILYADVANLRNPAPPANSVDTRAIMSLDAYGPVPPINEDDPNNSIVTYPADYVYRSHAERLLNRNDLERVHFLTLRHPWGLQPREADAPVLFDENIYIDFDELDARERDNRAPAKAWNVLEADNDTAENSEFVTATEDYDTLVWTYKLSRDASEDRFDLDNPQFGFVNYTDTFSFRPDMVVGGEDVRGIAEGLMLNPRNEIHSRYVMVHADWRDSDPAPSFLNGKIDFDANISPKRQDIRVDGNHSPATPDADPFTVPCQEASFMAIGMDFNAQGEFLGYISRYCEVDSRNHAIQFATVGILKDSCSEFVSVYDDTADLLTGTTNKAWTNKVWEGSKNPDGEIRDAGGRFARVKRDTDNTPFGSLFFTHSQIARAAARDLPRAGNSEQVLSNYVFGTPQQEGIPYACVDDWLGYSMMQDRFPENGRERCGATHNNIRLSNIGSAATARTAIANLFAKSFKIATFDYVYDLQNQAVTQDRPDIDEDGNDQAAQIGGASLQPPQIYSLNPFTCAQGTDCSAAEENAFSINRKNATLFDYNGDGIADEDVDNDSVPDAHIGVGSYLVQAEFFAFADDNRMPIRRVMVDWGEGRNGEITNRERRGLYKNRKPVCEQSDIGGEAVIDLCVDENTGIATGLTCSVEDSACPSGQRCEAVGQYADDNPDHATKRFGNLPRACTEDHFLFSHEYTCGQSDITPDLNGNFENYVQQVSALPEAHRQRVLALGDITPDDRICVFTPKVQVQDNWGWCNGSCNGAGNTGCYAEGGGPNGRQCIVDNDDAWAYYGNGEGLIIVLPPKPPEQEQ